MKQIIVYGGPGCPDCTRSKKVLADHDLPFDYRDIKSDPDAYEEFMALVGDGFQSIPRILFQAGETEVAMETKATLIEPERPELEAALIKHGFIPEQTSTDI